MSTDLCPEALRTTEEQTSDALDAPKSVSAAVNPASYSDELIRDP